MRTTILTIVFILATQCSMAQIDFSFRLENGLRYPEQVGYGAFADIGIYPSIYIGLSTFEFGYIKRSHTYSEVSFGDAPTGQIFFGDDRYLVDSYNLYLGRKFQFDKAKFRYGLLYGFCPNTRYYETSAPSVISKEYEAKALTAGAEIEFAYSFYNDFSFFAGAGPLIFISYGAPETRVMYINLYLKLGFEYNLKLPREKN